jgi:DNA-directed RNA polymerase beta' subunit
MLIFPKRHRPEQLHIWAVKHIVHVSLSLLVHQSLIATDAKASFWHKESVTRRLQDYETLTSRKLNLKESVIIILDRKALVKQHACVQEVVEATQRRWGWMEQVSSHFAEDVPWILFQVPLEHPCLLAWIKDIKQSVSTVSNMGSWRNLKLSLALDHLMETSVRGLTHVTDYTLEEVKIESWQASTRTLVTKPRWAVRTQGSDLGHILSRSDVDGHLTLCNHIKEVERTLGIGAACACLEGELMQVLNAGGDSSVQHRYISLLASRMCATGEVCGCTISDMAQDDVSVLKLASFEKCLPNILEGCVHGRVDPCVGVTECKVMSRLTYSGTGSVSLVSKPSAAGVSLQGVKDLVKHADEQRARQAPVLYPMEPAHVDDIWLQLPQMSEPK